ncbi:MAG: hypothetical protein BWY26_00348 [Elusimicrobia bacterium ADurb.Bin231]|nr:MAG: hypothetical protein BWY26_00348 [Elusimicrobia bacterium ADurb.Bin231]
MKKYLNNQLNYLTMNKYVIVITAQEDIFLPAYKGSTFRGGFGNAFKKICCIQRHSECVKCILRDKCAYSFIFESSPLSDSQKLKNLEEIPRPFVIEPPLAKETKYHAGDILKFGLILFGKAVEFLPYMIYTFAELGKIGIGKGRGKFELKEVLDITGKVIYDSQTGVLKNTIKEAILSDSEESCLYNSLKINFLTPTRIKFNGHYTSNPEFHILFRTLLRRISNLMYFYCGKSLDINFKETISQSERIKIKNINVKWHDWERYSSRQNTRMSLGGFVGEAEYSGDIMPFMPFLRLGEYTHIGKNCTFGLGKYEIGKN